jgi:uncharacterized protein DUF4112
MLNEMPIDAELAALNRLKALERLLDRQFSVGGVQFGIDSIIGLVPLVGDLVTGALGLFVIAEARRIGVSRWTMTRMYTNWGLDVTFGAVPIVGDLFDLAFKSNTKNVRLLIDEIEKRMDKGRRNATTAFDGDIIEHEPLEKRVQRSPGRARSAPRR